MTMKRTAEVIAWPNSVAQTAGMVRAAAGQRSAGVGVRDGSTGQRLPLRPVVEEPQTTVQKGETGGKKPAGSVRLERVWAVAEETARERSARPGARQDEMVAFYRKHTEALLRRYLRLSMTSGRVPSVMGREIFRGRASHYKANSLEDVVIFCYDMEQRIGRLQPTERKLLAKIAMQQYSQGEVAAMMGLSLRHTVRLYGSALDSLTRMLLEAGLLRPLFGSQEAEAC